MKYAICMLAHKEPELLVRIINILKAPNTKIYVHLDKRCNIRDFNKNIPAEFISERVKVYWGGRSMVIAMHNLINRVVEDNDCDYILFISGQDYPLIHPAEYDECIDKRKNYIEYKPIPREDWYHGGNDRIKTYYFFKNHKRLLSRISKKVQEILQVNRKLENKFKIFGGSQWININIDVAKYIIEHWKTYFRYFRYVNIPDELLFQTIIMNSHYAESVVNDNLRYIVFRDISPNPIVLNENDFEKILSAPGLFCRKVENNTLLDMIDLNILKI